MVFGAGAVGSALAGYLARRGHPVIAVAREAHAEAVTRQGGLRVRSREETFLAPVRAETRLSSEVPAGAVLMLAMQAPDVEASLDAVAPLAASRPVITWQNGIRSEAIAARRCPDVLGGIVRFTSTLLEPGEVRLRLPGQLIVGRFPSGRDPVAETVVADLAAAGFTARESPDIRVEKALKLLVNLVSGPAVLVHRTEPDLALARVQTVLLEEAVRVFAAAGIRAEPLSGLGQTVEELIAGFRSGGTAPDTSGGIYNSTWQNLHHGRPRLENDGYHGEIVRLGRDHGIEAPVNARVLEVLEAVRARGLGPEPFSPAEFRALFEGWVRFDLGEAPGAAPKDLEI